VYSKPSAPRSIGGVLDDGFRLGRAAFAKTWPLAFAAQILVALPFVLFKAQSGGGALGGGALGDGAQANMMALQSPGYSLLYLALALVSAGFQNAITAQNDSVARGADRTMGESLSIGFRLLPRTLLLGLLLVLGFLLIAVCFIIPGLFVGRAGRVLLVALFLVPVFFYLGRVFLANVIFVVEDAGAYASLLRSWQLTKDHFWRTGAILTVLFVVLIVVLLLIGFLSGLVAVTLGAKGAISVTVVQLISAGGNTLFTPFISAVLLSIYYDLKLRKEGTDLAGRVESLATR
jgi:hypothetical protein